MPMSNFDFRNATLSPAERSCIVSKEVFTFEDIGRLYCFSYDEARNLLNAIKFKSDRLKMRGKIHVLDYCAFFNISLAELRG